ncbi:MAG: hypothetical protein LPK00_00860 [Bacillaceae bacterium]|nr:hypothetical protein [Bacillaceae bacterium]
MQKNSKFIILLLFSVLIVSACSSNKELVGVWEDEWLGMLSMEFKSDGTVIISNGFSEEEAKYKVKGKQISMKIGKETVKLDYEIKDDKLTITGDGEELLLNRRK